MLLGPDQIAAAFTPKNRKPPPFPNLRLTAAPYLWQGDMVVWPFWQGARYLYKGQSIAATSIVNFSHRASIYGLGYGQDADDSTTSIMQYPSSVFDRGSISDLTLIAWMVPSKNSNDGPGPGWDQVAANTAANNDGVRAFLMADHTTSYDSRWRIPEAAGNVDLSYPAGFYSSGDLIQYVGRLGGGTQDLDIFNFRTKQSVSASSATSASITFDEGSFYVGQVDNGTDGSFPGDFLLLSLHFLRLSDAVIAKNRMDPFAMLRPDIHKLNSIIAGAAQSTLGGGIPEAVAVHHQRNHNRAI